MTGAAHVFAFRGDITHLACDAWVLPTDKELHLTAAWAGVPGIERRFEVSAGFRSGEVLAEQLPGHVGDAAVPILTAVPYSGGDSYSDDVDRRVVAGLTVGAEVSRRRTSDRRRSRALVALPLFGTSGGGGGAARGEFIGRLLATARRVAEEEQVDVALVLRSEADEALAQRIRREDAGAWAALPSELSDIARRLAESARRGVLVPFMGAGVSFTAGLPLWGPLMTALSEEGGLDPELREQFGELDVLDQAVVVRQLFEEKQEDFRAAIAARTNADRYGLAPVLLAGLRPREAVTLNYDGLYELASRDLGDPVTVLPEDPADPERRWLLKLHGSVSQPETVVLTRDDYLAFGKARAALASLAKAMLLTRHLLFVGFGFSDDHFHELMHEVREVLPAERRGSRRLGTALMLRSDPLQDRLWRDDVQFVPMTDGPDGGEGRLLEILLDKVLAHARTAGQFFLDDRYAHALSEDERRLKARILELVAATGEGERGTSAWTDLDELLRSWGLDA